MSWSTEHIIVREPGQEPRLTPVQVWNAPPGSRIDVERPSGPRRGLPETWLRATPQPLSPRPQQPTPPAPRLTDIARNPATREVYAKNLTWDQARYYAKGGDGARRRIRRAAWQGRDKRGEGTNVWIQCPRFLWFVDRDDVRQARVVQSHDFEEQEFRANDWEAEFPPGTTPPVPPEPPHPPFDPPVPPDPNPVCDCPRPPARAWGDPHFVISAGPNSFSAIWDDNHVPSAGLRTLLLRSGGAEVWYATAQGGPPGGMVVSEIWVIEPGQSDRRFRRTAQGLCEVIGQADQPMTSPWERTISLQTGGQIFVRVLPISRAGAAFFELECDFVPATRCLVTEMGGGLAWAYRRLVSENRPIVGPAGIGTGLQVDGWSWLGAPLGLKRSSIQFPDKGPLFAASRQFWMRMCAIVGMPLQRLADVVDYDPLLQEDWTPSTQSVCALQSFTQTQTNTLTGQSQSRLAQGTRPPQWRIIETAYGVVYSTGDAGSVPPETWTPPSYAYEGFMELQMKCDDQSDAWQTVHQWTTVEGEPTETLPRLGTTA